MPTPTATSSYYLYCSHVTIINDGLSDSFVSCYLLCTIRTITAHHSLVNQSNLLLTPYHRANGSIIMILLVITIRVPTSIIPLSYRSHHHIIIMHQSSIHRFISSRIINHLHYICIKWPVHVMCHAPLSSHPSSACQIRPLIPHLINAAYHTND